MFDPTDFPPFPSTIPAPSSHHPSFDRRSQPVPAAPYPLIEPITPSNSSISSTPSSVSIPNSTSSSSSVTPLTSPISQPSTVSPVFPDPAWAFPLPVSNYSPPLPKPTYAPLPVNESRIIRFILPDDLALNGHLPVAGAPGLLSIHTLSGRTQHQRAHLTPFKLRSLGGCDEDFIEPNPSQGVCIPRDEGIVYYADLRSRADYLAKGVNDVLDPLVFSRIVPGHGQVRVRAYTRTKSFPRSRNVQVGLPGCRCPVAVPCKTGAEDVERYKNSGAAELLCVMKPTYKVAPLHSDDEEKQTARRFMWLQPRMEYQVILLGAGAEDWSVVGVEIMWSEAANDREVNHKRLKKWTIWPRQAECAPIQVKDERKRADEEKEAGQEQPPTNSQLDLDMLAREAAEGFDEEDFADMGEEVDVEDQEEGEEVEGEDEGEVEYVRVKMEESAHVDEAVGMEVAPVAPPPAAVGDAMEPLIDLMARTTVEDDLSAVSPTTESSAAAPHKDQPSGQ